MHYVWICPCLDLFPWNPPNPDCARLSCEAQKTVNPLIGALRVSKYQFRKASQGFTFLKIYKPSSCTSAMFFYPVRMDAVNTECFRRAACQNQRWNMQGPSKTGEIAYARMELFVGLHTTDSPLPGMIKEDGSHMGRTDAFFLQTRLKFLQPAGLEFWKKPCLIFHSGGRCACLWAEQGQRAPGHL